MSKELVIAAAPHETRVAIVEDGQLCEIYVEREKELALVGSIYKGRVTRVLPGMQSAFVDIGLDSDAFLYVSDFMENLEEYDHIVSTVVGKVQKMEDQGGRVFSAPEGAPAGESNGETPESPAPAAEESMPMASAPAEPAPGNGGEHASQASRSEDLPGESRAPAGSAPPPQGNFEPRREFRGRGGFGRDRGPRGDRGDRGRGDRGGRGGRGGRGRFGRGGDRPRDREFPASKYASHRPYEPPEAARPGEPYEPVILPGESFAKYKERPPAPVASGSGSLPETLFQPAAQESAAAPVIDTFEAREESAPAMHEPVPEPFVEEHFEATPAPAPVEASADREESHTETVAHAAAEETIRAAAEPELSDEEVSNLAAQMLDVEHEQAEALAEAESEAENGVEDAGEEDEHEEMEAAGEESSPESEDEHIRRQILQSVVDENAPDAEPGTTTARVETNTRARFQRPMRRGGKRRGRGGPMRRGPHQRHHQAPRRPQMIAELLKAGQEIIVQIAKEPLGKKGARITSHVALPGRFLVYMPTVDHIGVSRKIASAEKRSRLRHLVNEAKGTFPGGFIVRTAAEAASEDEIRADVEFLGKTWSNIKASGEQRKAPSLLHRDLNLVERILRDHLTPDYSAIWIDSEEEYTKVVEFVERFQPDMVNRVKLFTKDRPIFEELGIQQEIDKSLRPKVWLKSGGYIVINHTEALVAIDVNTGKFVGKGSTRLEDTIVRANLEAVKEIVRQIRLRDLGGIIVADFIDMEERRNRDKVMAALEDALRTDRAPSKVLPFNEFGLVAITRKRTKQALERVLCQPCPYCTGSGMVKSMPTICYEIQAEARKMAGELEAASITLRVHPEIAKALKTRESALVEELENWTRKSVIIQSDASLHWEQYDIY